jgi:hypothetical protein
LSRFTLPFLLLLGLLLVACGSTQPRLDLPVAKVDLGDVPNGQIVTRDLSVRNEGQAELVFDAVTTSCGCTQATLEPMTIAPGQSGTLHIVFDSGAHGPELRGPLIRQVFLDSNDPQQPEAAVELAANIVDPGTIP